MEISIAGGRSSVLCSLRSRRGRRYMTQESNMACRGIHFLTGQATTIGAEKGNYCEVA